MDEPDKAGDQADNTIRLCLDLRFLNKLVVKNVYMLPRISDILESLKGQKYLSKIDIREAL